MLQLKLPVHVIGALKYAGLGVYLLYLKCLAAVKPIYLLSEAG